MCVTLTVKVLSLLLIDYRSYQMQRLSGTKQKITYNQLVFDLLNVLKLINLVRSSVASSSRDC